MTVHRTLTDFLSMFDQAGVPQAAPPPQPTPQPSPQPTPQFDANDPRTQAAMAFARQQEREAHHANLERERQARTAAEQQANAAAQAAAAQAAELEVVRAKQAEAERLAEEARINGLPKAEKLEARVEQLSQELEQRDARLEATVQAANQNILGWQVQAEINRIMADTQGKIEAHMLDTSSIPALQASVPRAIEAFNQRRNAFFEEFRGMMAATPGGSAIVEGLAPGPGQIGLPTPNNAGSPAPADAAGQAPQFVHPQLDGGTSYAAAQQVLHGRIQQAVPPGQGQIFQPTYPQQQPPQPVVQPQGYPTGPAGMPNMGAPPPGMSPQQLQQWYFMQHQQQQPGGQAPAPYAAAAPLPDPALAAGAMPGMRGLSDVEASAAVQHAQATIAKFRQGPQGATAGQVDGNGVGLFPPGTAAPSHHPNPGAPMGQQGMHGHGHPMARNT